MQQVRDRRANHHSIVRDLPGTCFETHTKRQNADTRVMGVRRVFHSFQHHCKIVSPDNDSACLPRSTSLDNLKSLSFHKILPEHPKRNVFKGRTKSSTLTHWSVRSFRTLDQTLVSHSSRTPSLFPKVSMRTLWVTNVTGLSQSHPTRMWFCERTLFDPLTIGGGFTFVDINV